MGCHQISLKPRDQAACLRHLKSRNEQTNRIKRRARANAHLKNYKRRKSHFDQDSKANRSLNSGETAAFLDKPQF
jgi:hypothetical protein